MPGAVGRHRHAQDGPGQERRRFRASLPAVCAIGDRRQWRRPACLLAAQRGDRRASRCAGCRDHRGGDHRRLETAGRDLCRRSQRLRPGPRHAPSRNLEHQARRHRGQRRRARRMQRSRRHLGAPRVRRPGRMARLAAARGRAAGGGRCRARDARRQSLSRRRQTAGLQAAAGRRAGIGRHDLPRRRRYRHSPDPAAGIRLAGLAGRRRGRDRRPPARRHPRRRGTPRRDLELAARRGGDPPHDRHRAGEIWRPGREARRQPGQGPRETRCGEGCRPRRRRCRKTGGRQGKPRPQRRTRSPRPARPPSPVGPTVAAR